MFKLEAEEAEHQRHLMESGDGIVHVSGRDQPPEDDAETEDDGETE